MNYIYIFQVLSPKLIENSRKRGNEQAVEDIFNEHQYCCKNSNNEMNEYLNLKSNILKGVWKIRLPDSHCIPYYNNNSNRVLYSFFDSEDSGNDETRPPFATKMVRFFELLCL